MRRILSAHDRECLIAVAALPRLIVNNGLLGSEIDRRFGSLIDPLRGSHEGGCGQDGLAAIVDFKLL